MRKETEGNKKWQATYITPLRPNTLAAFPPWGDSKGAGCVGLAVANLQRISCLRNKKLKIYVT